MCANKAITTVGTRHQQREMHPYHSVLDVAISRRAFLPRVEGIFQEPLITKKLPPLIPASRVLLGRGYNSAASLVLNWHREMSGGEENSCTEKMLKTL